MAYTKVLLSSKGNAIRKSEVVPGEAVGIQTGESISPGMLVELDASYDAAPQSTAGSKVPFRVAVEQEISGMTIDDAYTPDGDFQGMEYASVPAGDSVVAILVDGETVAVDDKLVSNGDGKLRAEDGDTSVTDDDSAAIAIALEAKAASGSDEFIRVEVL